MNSLTLCLSRFWKEESGMVVSAEAVTVGAIGVMGAVVGANAISSAVDTELRDAAHAIRSLDQSFIYAGHRGCGAWTAGSYYIQPNEDQTVTEPDPAVEPELRAIRKRIDDERRAFSLPPSQIRKIAEPTPAPVPRLEPTPDPRPNQIPVPEKKPDGPTPLNP